MEIIYLICIGVIGYVVAKCIEKSSPGKQTSDRSVQTLRQYEEPQDFQVNTPYHKHDYDVRGASIASEAGLYGTTRRTYLSPTGNLETIDG